ncbi:MAG TPA: hypothetical protein VIT38_10270 [Allosphingosinicella sp.]|jgi:hypothetical protein
MAWTTLSTRLNGLPKVLAGPILRRVEKNSVSVWIACKESFAAELFIARAFNNAQKLDIKNAANQLVSSPPIVQSIQLGANLHVALVTVAPSTPLSPGVIYQYSLRLKFGATRLWLDEQGVLTTSTGLSKITLGSGAGSMPGPTFLLPAASLDNLKFAHASCRKPHGGDIDALAALAAVLETTAANPSQRPQQLFLTGDQIYADDVDDALLHMLMEASETLLAWTKPEAAPGIPAPPRPGKRQPIVEATNFTTTDGQSHLIYLGEFYAMYLFAWSDTLWPPPETTPPFNDSFPSFSQVYGAASQSENRTYYSGASLMAAGTPRVVAVPTKEFSVEDAKRLKLYQRDLPAVRKAMANIPSYMMFDDHEVTDDWFISRDWCRKTLTAGALSRRIMQNALAAFAVFQAWGNTPAQFGAGTRGGNLLALLAARAQSPTNFSDDSIGNALLPALDATGKTLVQSADTPDWHFQIDFGAFTLIALDTRTHRGFDSEWQAARLISSAHLASQIPNLSGKNCVLVVSPAPVIGYLPVEEMLQLGADVSESVVSTATSTKPVTAGVVKIPDNLLVKLLPVGPTLRTGTLIAIRTYKYIHTEDERERDAGRCRQFTLGALDFEAWGYHQEALQEVLERLSSCPKVIILSGDVHYGFSIGIQYWNNRGQLDTFSGMVQLCSSSTRNTGALAVGVEKFATYSAGLLGLQSLVRYGWIASDGKPRVLDHRPPQEGPPAFRYRLTYAADVRDPVVRDLPATGPMPSDSKSLAGFYKKLLWLGQERIVVSRDHICLVELSPTLTNLWVRQDFYWSPVEDDPLAAPPCQPHTHHDVELDWVARPAKP